ncbi:m52L [Myxoma virus]|nr:m52L [Myxoma virus]
MIEPKQSTVYGIIAKAVTSSVTKGLFNANNVDYLYNKAKQLYSSAPTIKENVINGIYSFCENNIVVRDIPHLVEILNNLKHNSVYVCNSNEFWRLYNSLSRFTHCKSFFTACMYTIIATLSTLVTLVLSNKLLHAADMIESIESYLFAAQKPPAQELSDLLEMKYGLINLVQYKIFPIILGKCYLPIQHPPNFSAGAMSPSYSVEVTKLMELPVKTSIIDNVYTFLSEKGLRTTNNVAEYIAGLKIEELQNDENVQKALTTLHAARNYSKGHVLDGKVSSPITKNETLGGQIPLTVSDIEKFTILEYLYLMRVMTNAIKKKTTESKNTGIVLNINSPFKSITVPGVNLVK